MQLVLEKKVAKIENNLTKPKKKIIIPHHLGAFVGRSSKKNTEIHFETGIPRARLSVIMDPKVNSMTMDEFYLIGLSLKADLDEMDEEIFKDYVIGEEHDVEEKSFKTTFDKYLSSILINQRELSNKARINENRISKLRNDKTTIPLAHEIHSTVKVLKGKVSEAYKTLCGHLDLKTPAEQQQLREKYISDLTIQKAKREAKEFIQELINSGYFKDKKRTEEDIFSQAKLKFGEEHDNSFLLNSLDLYVDKEQLLSKEVNNDKTYYSNK